MESCPELEPEIPKAGPLVLKIGWRWPKLCLECSLTGRKNEGNKFLERRPRKTLSTKVVKRVELSMVLDKRPDNDPSIFFSLNAFEVLA